MLDPAFVIDAIARLKAADPDLALFGAQMHGYELNPALSPREIELFEQTYRIALPPDYRGYLLEIANGGAGPAYGVFKLGEMDNNYGVRVWSENDGCVGVLAEPWPHTEIWNDLSGSPHEEDGLTYAEIDAANAAFEERYFADHYINGAFPICHEGCAIRDFLVVSGPEAGHVWVDDRPSDGGIYPFSRDSSQATSFSSWYMSWLNDALDHFGLR